MKSKDVIKMLQKVDPSGETEVCVGNEDIYFAESKPAYWDGVLQVLIRDPKLSGCYNVEGVEFRSDGDKIELHVLSYSDVLLNDVDARMEYASEYAERHEKESVEDTREEMKKVHEEVEES